MLVVTVLVLQLLVSGVGAGLTSSVTETRLQQVTRDSTALGHKDKMSCRHIVTETTCQFSRHVQLFRPFIIFTISADTFDFLPFTN